MWFTSKNTLKEVKTLSSGENIKLNKKTIRMSKGSSKHNSYCKQQLIKQYSYLFLQFNGGGGATLQTPNDVRGEKKLYGNSGPRPS